MQPLTKCSRAYGHVRVRSDCPDIQIHRNVLYAGKGLYDWRRRLIPSAAYFQGVRLPDRALGEPLQGHTNDLDPARVTAEAPDDVYIWGGPLFNHFGHFLLDTLSRLYFLRGTPVHPKVIFWSNEPVENRSLRDYQTVLFEFIGLRSKDIVFIDRPTRIREILIHSPGFECNSYIHADFAAFCQSVGNEIVNWETNLSTQPLYIGKHRLEGGVARLTNELALVEILDREGVKIVSPELLDFQQQVTLWMSHQTITGYLGSATHTALFSRNKNITLINHENQVYSNQIMIDIASHHHAEYYSTAQSSERLGAGDGFHLNFRLNSPQETANQLLRIIDQANKSKHRPRVGFGYKSVDWRAYIDEPFGINLSLGKSADQSSIFPPHSIGATTITDACRATDGHLHESYAFHTSLEDNPWWQVDLGSLCQINEVRIFNRLDIGNENSRAFHILLSDDGIDFTIQHTRDAEPFGLPDGKPYRWLCDQSPTTRFVRIQLIGRRYLHLIQVEVFGERLSPT